MARSSSTSRAAKLAQRSGRSKVRFQGGTLFPAIVAAVLVVGLATIVYARQSRPEADASPPTVNDHWHASYGFYLCDAETGEMAWTQLQGDRELRDESGDRIGLEQKYEATGVHSHDDGVIHWHPFTSRSTGRNATLGLFLDVYDVELSNSQLKFPDEQNGGTDYEAGETKCGDQDGELRVQVWQNFDDEGGGKTYTTNFDDIELSKNSMVFSIAFVTDDVTIPKPPEANRLPELGEADGGSTELPTTGSSTPTGASTPGSATTGSGATSPSAPATGSTTAATTSGADRTPASAPPTSTS